MSLNYLDFEGITKNERGEFDGIDVLVAMARQGKIDPWAVDIVEVADMFSAHLFQSKAQNLRYSSRVILYAALLLKMKADILDGMDITEIIPQDSSELDAWGDDFMPDDGMYDDYIPTNNVASFEEVLQRRTSVRLNRNRVVTLRDLVRQLEFYATLDKKVEIENAKKRAQQARRSRDLSRLTPADMVNLAHEEDYKLGASILRNNLTEILNREDKIELNELTLLGLDRITAYISVLFLVTEGDYTLKQDDFYGDLYVIKKPKSEEKTEEEIMNEMLIQNTLEDEVSAVVDNVVNLHDNVNIEEYNR
ncbi:MAG: segregation/condensation protein A [Candidatus Gastranaerophilales bacterium]|nr:segregation/condensation protein A [Candidatus Gastranaerophilales bacterium]